MTNPVPWSLCGASTAENRIPPSPTMGLSPVPLVKSSSSPGAVQCFPGLNRKRISAGVLGRIIWLSQSGKPGRPIRGGQTSAGRPSPRFWSDKHHLQKRGYISITILPGLPARPLQPIQFSRLPRGFIPMGPQYPKTTPARTSRLRDLALSSSWAARRPSGSFRLSAQGP